MPNHDEEEPRGGPEVQLATEPVERAKADRRRSGGALGQEESGVSDDLVGSSPRTPVGQWWASSTMAPLNMTARPGDYDKVSADLADHLAQILGRVTVDRPAWRHESASP